jgi:hypothetical protein
MKYIFVIGLVTLLTSLSSNILAKEKRPLSGVDAYLHANTLMASGEESGSVPTPPSPSIAQACGSTTLYRDNPPSGTTYYWQTSSTGTSTSNSSYYYRTYTNGYVYLRAYKSGTWSSARSVYVTIKEIPEKPTAYDDYTCGAGYVNLNASVHNSGASIRWYQGSTLVSSNSSYSPYVHSSTTYTAKAYLNGCESSGDNAVAEIRSIPATPTGSGDTRCGTGIVNLSATTTTSDATIKWHEGSTLKSEGEHYSQNISTSTTFTAKAYKNGCTSNPRNVTATVKPIPTPPSLSVEHSCGPGQVTLSGYSNSSGATIKWYLGSTLKSSGETYSPTINSNTTYTGKSYKDGCTSSGTNITAQIKPIPAAPSVSNGFTCNSGYVNLYASAVTSGSILSWYNSSGSLVETGNIYKPYIHSTANYTVTATKDGCESSGATATAEWRSMPTVPTTNNGERCGPGEVSLTASNTTTGAVLKWYEGNTLKASSESTFIPNISSTTTYTVKSEKNECLSDGRSVIATIKTVPSIGHAPDVSRVEAGSLTLSAQPVPSSALVAWLDKNTLSNLTEGTSYSPTLSETKSYYAEPFYNGCHGDKVEVTAIIEALDIQKVATPTGDAYLMEDTYDPYGQGEFPNYNVDKLGGAFNLQITSNAAWEIKNLPPWVSIDEAYRSGLAGTSNVPISYSANYNGGLRIEVARIEAAGKTLSFCFTQPEITLLASAETDNYKEKVFNENTGTTEYTTRYSATDFILNINANTNWEVEFSSEANAFMSTTDATRGSGNGIIHLSFNQNSSTARSGNLLLKHNDATIKTYKIIQDKVVPTKASKGKNFVMSTNYRDNGIVASQSVQYFDLLGKATQGISRNLEEGKVIAAESIYDNYGRPIITTLPAVADQSSLEYVEEFCNGTTFTHDDTYTSLLNKYYSNDNADEPHVPHDRTPYSEVEYSQTIPGAVRKSYMVGDAAADKFATGFTVSASPDEIYNHPLRSRITLKDLKFPMGNETREDYKGITKSVTRDIMGKESVTYFDAEGRAIASCMTSPDAARDYVLTNTIKTENEIGYIDIHLPNDGNGTYTITKNSNWYSKVINLVEDNVAIHETQATNLLLDPGFYRITCYDDNFRVDNYEFYFNMAYKYHSFNAYDNASRLVRTISPEHVKQIVDDKLSPTAIDQYVTRNTYNALGWLMESYSPDEGTTRYKYRKDGKIRFSQNAQQRIENKFSYSNYDKHGRIVEVGAKIETPGVTWNDLDLYLEDVSNQGDGVAGDTAQCFDETYTWYGMPALDAPRPQTFTRGKVVKTKNANTTTWYSYNYDGTIDWVIQHIQGFDSDGDGTLTTNDYITLDYTYDFVGNATEVVYQAGKTDEFIHFYEYDFNNRLNEVYTLAADNLKGDNGQWFFNNSLIDNSSNDNAMIASNHAFSTDRFGETNEALELNSSSDYELSIPYSEAYNYSTNSFSVSVWVYVEGALSPWTNILHKNNCRTGYAGASTNGIAIGQFGSTAYRFFAAVKGEGGNDVLANVYGDGQQGWNHIVLVANRESGYLVNRIKVKYHHLIG